jgi:acyl dehydratase
VTAAALNATVPNHPITEWLSSAPTGTVTAWGPTKRGSGMIEVGDTASRSRVVAASDIEHFTEISGDRNPLHYDAEVAEASRFGRVIVQGGVTSGLLNALVAQDLPGPGSVFLNVNWNFRSAVGPGDEITATAEVLEARTDKPIYTLATTITDQEGTVVLDGTALVWQEPIDSE